MSGGGGGGGFDATKKEDFGKVPGRSSGVTASDIAGGDVGKMTPGKTTDVIQTYTTGVAFADNDARCATKGDSAGCFMSPGQRQRFEILLLDEIQTAQTNYKLALIELKVDELVEKDDDLNWMASIILDLATTHLSTIFSGALKGLKGKKVQGPEEFGLGLDVEMPKDDKSARWKCLGDFAAKVEQALP